MSNATVALVVLAVLFWVYVLAALSRSREADAGVGGARRSWELLIARIRRAAQRARR